MKIAVRFLYLALIIYISIDNGYSADLFSISGYYKNFFAVYDPPRYLNSGNSVDTPEKGVVVNRLRIDISSDMTDRIEFNSSYSIAPRIQDNSLFYSDPIITGIDQFSYRAVDIDSRLYPCEDDTVGSFAIFHNLDRFYLGIKARKFDLYIGRQAIAWGSARVVNPTDILTPYKFEELDTEERIGVDAVRVRVPLGMLSELDAGAVLGKDFKYDTDAAFIRGKFYTLKSDISLLLIGFRENLLAGLDLATSWKGAGIWFETAYVWAGALKDNSDNEEGGNYLRASIGCDYSFGDKTYGFIEYHFNQAGAGDSRDYLNLLSKTAYTEGSVYLFGEHYLIPGLTYQITPLISYNGQLLTNLIDPSMYFNSLLEYNIAANFYLSAGAFIGIGKRPELGVSPDSLIKLGSEFGSYPDIYYTSFSIYF